MGVYSGIKVQSCCFSSGASTFPAGPWSAPLGGLVCSVAKTFWASPFLLEPCDVCGSFYICDGPAVKRITFLRSPASFRFNTVLRDSIWVLAVLTVTGALLLCSPLGQSWLLHACVLIHMCACVHAQLCLTLCNPLDCDPPGSSLHGILQARTLEWAAISFSKGSSQPRDQTCVSLSPALTGGFFTTSTTWEACTNPHLHTCLHR